MLKYALKLTALLLFIIFILFMLPACGSGEMQNSAHTFNTPGLEFSSSVYVSASVPGFSASATPAPATPSAGVTTAQAQLSPSLPSLTTSVSETSPYLTALPTQSSVAATRPTATPAPSSTPTPTLIPSRPAASADSTYAPLSISQIISQMTLEEKVGQLFMPRCPAKNVSSYIKKYHPAGLVLYARDFDGKSAEQVRAELASYQLASQIPMLLSTDEEGGTVVRVSKNPQLRAQPFDSPQEVYKSGGMSGLIADTREKSRLLISLGINVNLAPVCDVSTNPDDYIYKRSMGLDAEGTALCIEQIVTTMKKEGVSSVLKHFPGYGGNVDTHTGIAVDERPYSQFVREDFLPFISGMDAGAQGVLIAHNIVKCMDEDAPASLSANVHAILREDLGFTGVIMTDDLSMDAISLYTGGQSPAVAAVLAGNDLLLTSDWEEHYTDVLDAVCEKVISVSRLEESVERILLWKEAQGLLS